MCTTESSTDERVVCDIVMREAGGTTGASGESDRARGQRL
jgi:hypothetical protein